MSSSVAFPLHGSCACGEVKYTLNASPLIIHCCHCTECQVQTGSAFGINGIVEHFNVSYTANEPERVHLPGASGKGQSAARCGKCKTIIWSTYSMAGELMRFVRLGTWGQGSSRNRFVEGTSGA